MEIVAAELTAIIAIEHLYHPVDRNVCLVIARKEALAGSLQNALFKPTQEFAANRNLYNGFLARRADLALRYF